LAIAVVLELRKMEVSHMSIQEDPKTGRCLVQLSAADPLDRKDPLYEKKGKRWCQRVATRKLAETLEAQFKSEKKEWVAKRRLIKEARRLGLPLQALSTTPNRELGFARLLEENYLPWARQNLASQTLRSRESAMMVLAEDIGNRPLHQIEHVVDELIDKWRSEGCRHTVTEDRLGRALNRKARPISDAGINERLKILRAILGYAYMQAKVLSTPPRIRKIRKKRAAPGSAKPKRFFEHQERARFLRYADPAMKYVFLVAILTGLRPGELAHAKVRWIDFQQNRLLIQETHCALCEGGVWLPKTGEFRAVDLSPDVVPILRRLATGKADDALLIENTHGAPFSRLPGGGGKFIRTLQRAGLSRKGLTFYSLRHTFAADLITAGWELKTVADLLGNSVRTCELHYAHLMKGRTAEAVKDLKAATPWPTNGQPEEVSPATDSAEVDAAA
jgi:integrase